MFCPNCGLQDQSLGSFCKRCGTSLRVVAEALAPKPARDQDEDLIRKLAIQYKHTAAQKRAEGKRRILTATTILASISIAMTFIRSMTRQSEGSWPMWMMLLIGAGLAFIGLLMIQSRRSRRLAETETERRLTLTEGPKVRGSDHYDQKLAAETTRLNDQMPRKRIQE